MKFWFTGLMIAFIATLESCEGYRCGNGRVLDKMTGNSLDSVYCEALTSGVSMYTDSTGHYEVCNRIAGCFIECKDIIVRYSKSGYKTITRENPGDEVIYLER